MQPSSSAEALQREKAIIRKVIRERISRISPQDVAKQSADITSRVLQMPEYKSARHISLFLSMPNKEVSTSKLVEAAVSDGKRVFVPYIYMNTLEHHREMDMFELKPDERPALLVKDAWGIPTLRRDSIGTRRNALGGYGIERTGGFEEISNFVDLIFIPAVAFDSEKGRLGHGKGFYDRYLYKYSKIALSRNPNAKMPLLGANFPYQTGSQAYFSAVGLGLRQQLLEDGELVPTGKDDWPLDQLVIASGEESER